MAYDYCIGDDLLITDNVSDHCYPINTVVTVEDRASWHRSYFVTDGTTRQYVHECEVRRAEEGDGMLASL